MCGDGECIPRYLVCNDVKDCLDGSDEAVCGNATCPLEYSFAISTNGIFACCKTEPVTHDDGKQWCYSDLAPCSGARCKTFRVVGMSPVAIVGVVIVIIMTIFILISIAIIRPC